MNKLSALALLFACQLSQAQTIPNNLVRIPSLRGAPTRTPEVAVGDGPFRFVAWRWTNDAKFTATYHKNPSGNIYLVSKVYGEIATTGRIALKSEIGCNIIGLLTINQYVNNPYEFSATGKVFGCREDGLNGTFSGTVNKKGNTVIINFGANTVLNSSVISIESALSSY